MDNDRIKIIEDTQIRQGAEMSKLTRWVAIGTIGLLVWEILKAIYHHLPCIQKLLYIN